jgi:hypothetical protein
MRRNGFVEFSCILAFALTACNPAETGRTGIDGTLAALAPPDATMLSGIRMEAMRTTPLYQKMISRKALPQLDDFARQTGFDPRRDVRELLIASNGSDSLLAARGTFNLQGFEGATKTSYKDFTLYTRQNGAVGLLDSSTAVAGPVASVRAALDRYKAGDGSRPSELLARARQIPNNNQIWSVSNGFESLISRNLPQEGNAVNISRILRSLENTTFAADLRTGVNGYMDGLCRTAQDAKNLGDAARGLVGLGRLSVPENQPELLRLWDGIKVDQQQRTVKITLAIPQDLIDKLVDLLGKQPFQRLPVTRRGNRPADASWDQGSRRQESNRRPH